MKKGQIFLRPLERGETYMGDDVVVEIIGRHLTDIKQFCKIILNA
jgi:hypothetical protein